MEESNSSSSQVSGAQCSGEHSGERHEDISHEGAPTQDLHSRDGFAQDAHFVGAPLGNAYASSGNSAQIQPEQSGGHAFLRGVGSFLLTIVIVIVLFVLIRTFIFQSYEIPSGSMEETIQTGDLVFSEKISYYLGDPQRGDIVTFIDPMQPDRTLIKRVIAIGGQSVELRDGYVYVDGIKQDEPYVNGLPSYPLESTSSKRITYPYTVPEGEIWVMGDNRTNSQDSRYFGSVPVSSVTGRAVFKYWPLNDIGLL